MVKVTFRQEAINDLTDIWNYTKIEWSENQAEKYYQSIKISCKEIADKPNIGRTYNEISKYLLGLKTEKHIIFYCILSEFEVEIIRILHERMDLKTQLTK